MPTRKHVLDLVEQRVFDPITRAAPVDRTVLDSFLTAELEELASREQFTAYFAVYHDPLLRTTTGGREYLLPKDFPENFCIRGDKHVVVIGNASNQVDLTFVPPAEFFQKDLLSQGNSKPTEYTITSSPGGTRTMWLSPPPDANTSTQAYYLISGLYIPSFYGAEPRPESHLLEVPLPLLEYGLLRRIQPENQKWDLYYQTHLKQFYLKAAREEKIVLSPKQSSGGNYNAYKLVRY